MGTAVKVTVMVTELIHKSKLFPKPIMHLEPPPPPQQQQQQEQQQQQQQQQNNRRRRRRRRQNVGALIMFVILSLLSDLSERDPWWKRGTMGFLYIYIFFPSFYRKQADATTTTTKGWGRGCGGGGGGGQFYLACAVRIKISSFCNRWPGLF